MGYTQQLLLYYLLGCIAAYRIKTIFYIVVLGILNLSFTDPLIIVKTILPTTIIRVFLLCGKVSISQGTGLIWMVSAIFYIAFGKKVSSVVTTILLAIIIRLLYPNND